MEVAFYKEYVADLKKRIDDLHENPDDFQVYDLHMEILVRKAQVSYALSRRKGQRDSLFFVNDTVSGKRSQLTQDAALGMFEHFFRLGQFVAIAGTATERSEAEFTSLITSEWTYPVCAVAFSYRKKGQSKAQSTKMLFVGLNNDEDAHAYIRALNQPTLFVSDKPFVTQQLWEWK